MPARRSRSRPERSFTGWILGEIAILNQPAPTRTEAVYLALGVAIAVLGALTVA
jgi:hypothetical protein